MERSTEFFKGVVQIDADLEGESVKVPVFYYDTSAITGIFLAKMSKIKTFLPKKEYHPLPVMPGIGVIAITCFNYRDTDIRPYNEISISIPMVYKTCAGLPGIKILSSLRRNEFHVYVHHLPVTTKVALDGGVMLYNLPKFIANIEFEDTGSEIHVKLEEKGELILKIAAKKISAKQSKILRYVIYPVKENFAQHADILLNATEFGLTFTPGCLKLELGENHRIAKELGEAIIWKSPILYQYLPKLQAILYPPSRLE